MSGGAKETLLGFGLHVTAQRIAVLDAVSAQPHATADEIVAVARQHLGSISRQAVYCCSTGPS